MPTVVVAALLAAMLTLVGVPWVGGLASRWGVVDVPNERSSHAVPLPRGGGLAIAGVVSLAFPLVAAFDGSLPWIKVLTPVVAGAVVAGLGWLDDRRSLSARLRLAVQTTAAVLIVSVIGFFADIELPFLGSFHLGWFGVPLTIIWLVGLCNAYNFMDGIDGIAAGQGALSGVLWAAAGSAAGLPDVALMGALLAGACLGFLPYNWSPARIFMGDVGSGFLGLTFAWLTVLAVVRSGDPHFALAGVLFLGVFAFDTGFTLLRRAWRRENLLKAHRTHLYQRLIACGYSHRAVTLGCLGLGAALGACGLAALRGTSAVAVAALSVAALLLYAYWETVSALERRAAARRN